MSATATFSVTSRAAARIKSIVSDQKANAFRVAVEGGGCSGFRYDFTIVAEPAEDDLVIENDGAKVLIDPVSMTFLAGSVLDFQDDLIGQSFKVENPQAKSSCGCGTSFSF